MESNTTPEAPLEAKLAAEFGGKSQDHVVTAESNPELMRAFVAEALADIAENDN